MSKRKSLTDRLNTPIGGAVSAFTTPLVKDKTLDTINSIEKEVLNIANTTSKNNTPNAESYDIKNNTPNITLSESKNNTENATYNDSKLDTVNETNLNTNSDTKLNTNTLTNNVSNDITNNDTLNSTKTVTKNDANSESKNKTDNITKNVTKIETNNSAAVITNTKSIKIGNSIFKSTYTNVDDVKRAAYHLRQDTIDKIEKCSKLSGLKKAEFVDLVLNNILSDILNKVDK